ncbi:MAG: hypothetical protein KJP00_11565 [Bacteroidia bacterium]|nr:hypothetical protein [Bacteroidia bacterium]
MLYTLIKGMIGIAGLAVAWLIIQILWRDSFEEYMTEDKDALAGRSSCANCGCTTICQNKAQKIRSTHDDSIDKKSIAL